MSSLKSLLLSGGYKLDVSGYLQYIGSINNPVSLQLFNESVKEDPSEHYDYLFELAASRIVLLYSQECAFTNLYRQYNIHVKKRHGDQKSLLEVAIEARNDLFINWLISYSDSNFQFNPKALPQLALSLKDMDAYLFVRCLDNLSTQGQKELLHSLITRKPNEKVNTVLRQLLPKMSALLIEQTYAAAIMLGYGARIEPTLPLVFDEEVRNRLRARLEPFRPLSEDEAVSRDSVISAVALDDLIHHIQKSEPNLALIQKQLHDRALVSFKIGDFLRLLQETRGKPAILSMILNHYALTLGIQEYQTALKLDSSKDFPWELHLVVALLNLVCEFRENVESPYKKEAMAPFVNSIFKTPARDLTISRRDGVFAVTKCAIPLNVKAVHPNSSFKKTPSGVYITYSTDEGSVKRFLPIKSTVRDELLRLLFDLLKSDSMAPIVYREHMATRMGVSKLAWSEQTADTIYKENPSAKAYESFYQQFILPQIAQYFREGSTINIIDVGCGSGTLSQYLLRGYRGQFNYLGYDFNQGNIDLALSENNITPNLHFVQGDMLQHQGIIAHAREQGWIDPEKPTVVILSGSLTRLVLQDGFQALIALRAIIQTQPNLIIGGGLGEPLLTRSMMRRLGYKVVPLVNTELKAFAYESMTSDEYRDNKGHKVVERNFLVLSLLPEVIALELLNQFDSLLIQRKQIRAHYFTTVNKYTVIDISFCEISDKLISKLKLYAHSGAILVCKHNEQSVLDKLKLNFPGNEFSLVEDDYQLMHPYGFYQQVHGQQFFRDKPTLEESDFKSNEVIYVQR